MTIRYALVNGRNCVELTFWIISRHITAHIPVSLIARRSQVAGLKGFLQSLVNLSGTGHGLVIVDNRKKTYPSALLEPNNPKRPIVSIKTHARLQERANNIDSRKCYLEHIERLIRIAEGLCAIAATETPWEADGLRDDSKGQCFALPRIGKTKKVQHPFYVLSACSSLGSQNRWH